MNIDQFQMVDVAELSIVDRSEITNIDLIENVCITFNFILCEMNEMEVKVVGKSIH